MTVGGLLKRLWGRWSGCEGKLKACARVSRLAASSSLGIGLLTSPSVMVVQIRPVLLPGAPEARVAGPAVSCASPNVVISPTLFQTEELIHVVQISPLSNKPSSTFRCFLRCSVQRSERRTSFCQGSLAELQNRTNATQYRPYINQLSPLF